MSNLVLPVLPGMSFPVSKTPTWSTRIQTAASGRETRIGLWSYPRWKWGLQFEFLRNNVAAGYDELWTLLGFYNRHLGPYDSWLFDDPDDDAVVDQSFGVGDGTMTQFQLVRTRGGFVEPVTDLNGAIVVKKAGVVQALTSQYTIGTTGIVTLAAPPASGAALTWTGSFYWRCRFLSDTIDAEKFVQRIWELKKLEFMSIKT